MVGLKLTRRGIVVRGRGPESEAWGRQATKKPAYEAGSKPGCVVQEARERKFSQGFGMSPRSFGSIPRSDVGEFARGWKERREPGRVVLQMEAGRWATGAGGGWGELSQLQQAPHLPESTPWSKKKGRIPDAKSCLHRSHPGGFYQIQKESRRPTSYQRPPPDRCHHFPARDSFRLMQGLATRSCPLPPPPWLNNLSTILSSS